MRGLGLERQPGWIGGVCAGIGARIGIDPVIVRGIAVVIAVLGGPAFLLYAAAWLLLPDRTGSIHLERLLRASFDRAIAGIIAIFLLALLPITQAFWFLGEAFWSSSDFGPQVGLALGRAVWILLLVAAGITAVVWLNRRSARNAAGGAGAAAAAAAAAAAGAAGTAGGAAAKRAASKAASKDATDSAGTVRATALTAPASGIEPVLDSASAPVADPAVADPVSAAVPDPVSAEGGNAAPGGGWPAEPAAPASDASIDDLANWKLRQAEWKTSFDEWKRQQSLVHHEMSRQRGEAARARAAQSAAAAIERRALRKRANPRLRAGIAAIALGLALIAGTLASLIAEANTVLPIKPICAGLGAATIVIGFTMMVAGAFRRRTGFLGFIMSLLLIATVATGFAPRDQDLLRIGSGGDTATTISAHLSAPARPTSQAGAPS